MKSKQSESTTEAIPAATKPGSTKSPKKAKALTTEPETPVAGALIEPAPEPAAGDEPAIPPVPDAPAEPDAPVSTPKRVPKRKSKATPDAAAKGTLQSAFEGYLKSIENAGHSDSTVKSYRADLRIALDEMGADTQVASITQEQIEKYLGCRRITRTRAGKAKSEITKSKLRRTFRQALEWAEGKGLRAPVPAVAGASH